MTATCASRSFAPTTEEALFRQMEQGLVVEFSKKLDRRFRALHGAGKRQSYVVGSALCGQDKALADYLLSAGARFALIEFKANQEQLKTEGGKQQRRLLLDGCLAESGLRARSRDLHYVAWGEAAQLDLPGLGTQTKEVLMLSHYFDKIGGLLGMSVPRPRSRHWTDDAFITSYLEPMTAGSNLPRFRRYLIELYQLVGTSGGAGLDGFQGMVTVYIPGFKGEHQFQELRFNSFEHLLQLTIHHQPAPELAPEPQHKPGRAGPQMER
jgi:hypothetical protein